MYIFYGDHLAPSTYAPGGRKPQGLEDRRLESEEIYPREGIMVLLTWPMVRRCTKEPGGHQS
jgi:hypothetical protein